MSNRLCAWALAGLGLLGAAAPAAAGETARIAILPLLVHANEGHDYLRSGLADMLASRIGRVDGVAVVRIQDPTSATTDREKARATAREIGADFVVFGSFSAFGGGASLDVECAPTAAKDDDSFPQRGIFVQAGTLGEIIPRLDAVAHKVGRFALTGEMDGGNGNGSTPSVGAGPAGPTRADMDALSGRVDALEKAVLTRPTGAESPEAAVPPPIVEEDGVGRGPLQEDLDLLDPRANPLR